MKIKVRHICKHEDEFDLADHITKYLEDDPEKLKRYKAYLASGICAECYVKNTGYFKN